MLRNEPVVLINAIVALIETVIALLVAFGLDLTPEQMGAIMAVVVATATVIQTLVARSLVTPVANPHDNQGRPLQTEPGVAVSTTTTPIAAV